MTTPITVPLKETLAELEALGHEKVRKQNRKQGAGDKQFGVKLGDIRKMAAKIKRNDPLADALWESENLEARLLAILLIKPDKLSRNTVEQMVKSVNCVQLADWLNGYLVKNHPEKEVLRQAWMQENHPWAARAGWSLTSERIAKNPEGLDLPALLDRIAAEMGEAVSEVQWTMNFCLAGIGIHFPQHREQALAIGEKLGIYRDYPVSKGCTSPFAPIWINAMVKRAT